MLGLDVLAVLTTDRSWSCFTNLQRSCQGSRGKGAGLLSFIVTLSITTRCHGPSCPSGWVPVIVSVGGLFQWRAWSKQTTVRRTTVDAVYKPPDF